MSDVLVATDVRARLFEALQPLTRGALATVPERQRTAALDRLRLIVRPFPLKGETPGMRVFVVVIEPAGSAFAGEAIANGLVGDMPNRAHVEAAVEDVLALALAVLGEEAAADAVTAAQEHKAVLLVQARPATGDVKLVAVPRKGRPIVLGALVDAPATAH